ncbi:3-oxoacyl-[acyl-carrier-protein] reductase [Amylibacter sp.]|jgi:3-oxoacyl-[acyl-carrier protein] reductase|nr:3-oxoacyl-[acyl-carrier-protein] reductase [Amylibacter sp.]MDA8894355.1 3-oxoacyl-[acyl-carrier-protein] reductase [Amylibacter sp.]MDA9032058.1 3-oxoacyl-[acyl-carrier-protein] reductase [Amylibacter sp.]MDA9278296.1 3-oxoacyl-[acyl-carrier-protein] reductase [Amylibacter sp.]MDA9308177.1 3-oxoacyl-[acyl-carrier-protein] reductase [Amylibacter sp.]|tara:strand:- start:816 stop:1553 length:738 start_codon:yes stop_codon:yes gene_type:complete
MFELEGKCALITGASGGIGGSIARALYAQGAKVALSGTRIDPLKALADDLGDRAFIVPCNLSDVDAVKALPQKASEEMGGIDILVNNAGITKDNLFMRMSDDDWHQVIDVNLTSTMHLMKSVMRTMMKQRFGRIINITSIVGVTGNAGQVNYAASKAGMIGMTKSFAQEIATRGITANCIAPGFIETAMTAELPENVIKNMLDAIPQGRMGQADEVAASVAFLASNEASYITGQTLHVNGGMAMI